eukprot:1631282-Prymnesium_polylepis.1
MRRRGARRAAWRASGAPLGEDLRRHCDGDARRPLRAHLVSRPLLEGSFRFRERVFRRLLLSRDRLDHHLLVAQLLERLRKRGSPQGGKRLVKRSGVSSVCAWGVDDDAAARVARPAARGVWVLDFGSRRPAPGFHLRARA